MIILWNILIIAFAILVCFGIWGVLGTAYAIEKVIALVILLAMTIYMLKVINGV